MAEMLTSQLQTPVAHNGNAPTPPYRPEVIDKQDGKNHSWREALGIKFSLDSLFSYYAWLRFIGYFAAGGYSTFARGLYSRYGQQPRTTEDHAPVTEVSAAAINPGGNPGAKGQNLFFRKDGMCLNLGGRNEIQAQPGDRVRILTPGGGGFGVPPK